MPTVPLQQFFEVLEAGSAAVCGPAVFAALARAYASPEDVNMDATTMKLHIVCCGSDKDVAGIARLMSAHARELKQVSTHTEASAAGLGPALVSTRSWLVGAATSMVYLFQVDGRRLSTGVGTPDPGDEDGHRVAQMGEAVQRLFLADCLHFLFHRGVVHDVSEGGAATKHVIRRVVEVGRKALSAYKHRPPGDMTEIMWYAPWLELLWLIGAFSHAGFVASERVLRQMVACINRVMKVAVSQGWDVDTLWRSTIMHHCDRVLNADMTMTDGKMVLRRQQMPAPVPMPRDLPRTCFDLINLEHIPTNEWLNKHQGNILIIEARGAHPIGVSRQVLRQLITPQSIYFKCVGGGAGVDRTVRYFQLSLQNMNVLVEVAALNALLGSKHKVWSVSATGTRLERTGSATAFGANPWYVGAHHCQEGTDKRVYALRPVEFVGATQRARSLPANTRKALSSVRT